jgi:hypothetical protein
VAAGGGNKTIFAHIYPDASAAFADITSTWSAVALSDGVTNLCYATWVVPDDFTSLTSVELIWVTTSGGSGNARFTFTAVAITGTEDVVSGDSDTIAEASYADIGVARGRVASDVSAAFDGLTLTLGHEISFNCTRVGGSGSDTISDIVHVLGLKIVYA